MTFPAWSVVIVTQGDRPEALSRALASVMAQQDADLEVIVVGNGWEPANLPTGVIGVAVSENVGAPGGRNRGFAAATADLLFFLDDDATLPEPKTLAALGREFAADPGLGVVQIRIRSANGVTARRWVPGSPTRTPSAHHLWSRWSRARSRCGGRRSRPPTGGRVAFGTPTRA